MLVSVTLVTESVIENFVGGGSLTFQVKTQRRGPNGPAPRVSALPAKGGVPDQITASSEVQTRFPSWSIVQTSGAASSSNPGAATVALAVNVVASHTIE